jgi:hypothetical protein
MGCFEDYMQFRDEVDEAKKKIKGQGASNECRCMGDEMENKETSSSLESKPEER